MDDGDLKSLVIEENEEDGAVRFGARSPLKLFSRRVFIVTVVSLAVMLIAAIVVLISLWIIKDLNNQPPSFPSIVFPVSSSPLGIYKSAAVACDNGYCSTVAKNMLQQGGSAVDAAIAAVICNGVVNMHNLGLAGGSFAVIWDSQRGVSESIDSYGTAPSNVSNDLYLDQPDSLERGKLSILVPGEVAGYYELHRRYGKLPWDKLFSPAVNLCRQGFRIGPSLVEGIQYVQKHADLKKYPEMANLVSFLKNPKTGSWLKEGDAITCPELASTLEMIAKNGAADFYTGSLAEMIFADLEELGVPISKSDFASYKVNTTRQPFKMPMRDRLTLFTARPPSSGAAAAFVLNVLSDYNWTASASYDPLTYHRYLEALKFAWGQWSFLGDEAFVNEAELEQRLHNMSLLEMGKRVRQKINDKYALPIEDYGTYGTPPLFDDSHHSTSHVSILDASGNAVSMTSTINGHFGSFVMGKRTGLIFNNGMSNFFLNSTTNQSLPLPPNNYISPGKRPMSTISPMLFVNETAHPSRAVQLIVGASGSSRILCTVPYVAMRTLWFSENVKEAVDAYRFQHNLIPDVLYYEPVWPDWIMNYLRDKGHVVQKPFSTASSSISQAIQRLPNGTLFAISDFRKGGGYTDGY